MSMFDTMFQAKPPSVITTDVRNPAQTAADAGRLQAAGQYGNQFASIFPSILASTMGNRQSSLPPELMAAMLRDYAGGRGSGLPSYQDQLDQQQQVIDSTLSRVAGQGGQGSGYANAQAARGVVDYRSGLAKTLADYRLGMLGRIMSAAQVQDTARQNSAQTAAGLAGLPLQAMTGLYGQMGSPGMNAYQVQGKDDAASGIVGSMLGGGAGGGGFDFGSLLKLFSGMFKGGGSGGMNVGGGGGWPTTPPDSAVWT